MVESQLEKKQGTSFLALTVIVIVILVAVIGTLVVLVDPNFVFSLVSNSSTYTAGGLIYEVIYVVLYLITDILYLFGGGVIAFGALLVITRFVQQKLRNPYQPTSSTRTLSGYLTLSLNFFIGAEIVRTVIVGESEILLLLLVIASRGVFSLILYLERRWHGATESE